MKKNVLVLLVIISAFSLSSCKKIDELTHFNMTFDETFTLPAVSIIVDVPISYSFPVSTDSEETFLLNATSKDLIEEIILKEASLKVLSPLNGDFGFLKSVSFYLDADGLDEILIASKMEISPDIGKILFLDLQGQDLSAYLKKDEIILRVEVASDEIIPEELEIEIHTIFAVDAKILGV